MVYVHAERSSLLVGVTAGVRSSSEATRFTMKSSEPSCGTSFLPMRLLSSSVVFQPPSTLENVRVR